MMRPMSIVLKPMVQISKNKVPMNVNVTADYSLRHPTEDITKLAHKVNVAAAAAVNKAKDFTKQATTKIYGKVPSGKKPDQPKKDSKDVNRDGDFDEFELDDDAGGDQETTRRSTLKPFPQEEQQEEDEEERVDNDWD
uniref:WH2 domain-containing protein n=1 Tax=Rhabditophanes sp. KR3021 TaxID=114890 RepID=A0AC35UCC2_9BILA